MRGPVLVKAQDLSSILSLMELSKSVRAKIPVPDLPYDLSINIANSLFPSE